MGIANLCGTSLLDLGQIPLIAEIKVVIARVKLTDYVATAYAEWFGMTGPESPGTAEEKPYGWAGKYKP